MEREGDWIFVEDDNHLLIQLQTTSLSEKSDQDDSNVNNKCSYASALLKNPKQNGHQQQSILSAVQNKEKVVIKGDEDGEVIISYIEGKPGSQYRNPRDKAGKNKVHKSRPRSSTPPRNAGNSLKTGCSFCNPKFANRAERRRTLRQQRSITNWKDYDY